MARIMRAVKMILIKNLISNPLSKVYVDDIGRGLESMKLGMVYTKETETLSHSVIQKKWTKKKEYQGPRRPKKSCWIYSLVNPQIFNSQLRQ